MGGDFYLWIIFIFAFLLFRLRKRFKNGNGREYLEGALGKYSYGRLTRKFI